MCLKTVIKSGRIKKHKTAISIETPLSPITKDEYLLSFALYKDLLYKDVSFLSIRTCSKSWNVLVRFLLICSLTVKQNACIIRYIKEDVV